MNEKARKHIGMIAAPYIVGKLVMEDVIHNDDIYEVTLAISQGLNMAFKDYEEMPKQEGVEEKSTAKFTKVAGNYYVTTKSMDHILAIIAEDIRVDLPYEGALSDRDLEKIMSNIEETLEESLQECVVDLYRKDEVS